MVVSEEFDAEHVTQSGSWAQGLSKGVFAHKRKRCVDVKKKSQSPNRKSPSKKLKLSRKRSSLDSSQRGDVSTSSLVDESFVRCLASRCKEWTSERRSSYSRLFSQIFSTAAQLEEEIYTDVFGAIFSFVKDSSIVLNKTSIPTAVLLTGVNMPDHRSVFSLLVSKLNSVSPHIATVRSQLGLKALVNNIVVDLSTPADGEPGIKKTEASMSMLDVWYSNQYPSSSDPYDRPPLIVIIEDFEGIAGPALQDLITLMARYSTLPFLFIFGVSTTVGSVHRTLSHSSTSRLTLHTFGSPPATSHLDKIVERVVINHNIPFKIDGRVFKFLVENFLYHDFAVKHFLEGFKFILGEHFYRTPASHLCCEKGESQAHLLKMSNKQLDFIRRLPSFKSYVEDSLDLDQQADVLVNEKPCKALCGDLLDKYFEHQRLFTVLVKVLFTLTSNLPRRPFGKMLRVTYEMCLLPDLQDLPQWKEAWRYLQLSSRTDLQTKVTSIVEELKTLGSEVGSSWISKFEEYLVKLEQLASEPDVSQGSSLAGSPAISSLASAMADSPSLNSPLVLPSSLDTSTNPNTPLLSATNTPSLPGAAPLAKLDRFNLKASLLALKAAQSKPSAPRPFDSLRSTILESMQSLLASHLLPPSSLPLAELFTFSSLAGVKRHLVGAPRAATHTALTQPGEYLENSLLDISDPGEIPPTFPDLAIGYKLHLECPRLINVFDWLTCWDAIVASGEGKEGEEESQGPSDTNQARFARVLAELQLLGFIKTSTRKTDHVARLTFGGT